MKSFMKNMLSGLIVYKGKYSREIHLILSTPRKKKWNFC
jgi:hypothetical protein